MKRRGDHISSDDLQTQRIVRRKPLHRSISPVELETRTSKRLREFHEEKSDMYDKYSHKNHGSYHLEHHQSRKSSPHIREDKISKGGFNDRHHRLEYSPHFNDLKERNRDIHLLSGRREPPGHGSMSLPNHTSRQMVSPSDASFDYSLRVGNIDFTLTDNSVRSSLFREFKKFGYVNIKVIGYGKERHAYVNFNRADDARAACKGVQGLVLNGRHLDVGWSRSTLNRFPDLLTSKFHEPRGSGSNSSDGKKRHVEESYGNYQVNISSERDHYSNSSRTIRDISYRNGSSSSSSRERGHHSSTEKSQPPVAVMDPHATRTLFVGNLDMDITERELRDIFSPYGRIESVDIKTTKTTAYSFVKFITINDAINAKNELHGRQYGNFRLSIGFGKGTPVAKVWIGNITCFADVSEIRKELDRFGLIRRVDYVNDDNHCFVHFDGLDSAEAAVVSLKNYRFKRTNKPLKIDLMQHQPHREFNNHGGSSFDNFEPEVPVFESGGVERKDNGGRYRNRELHRDSGVRDYKLNDRGGGGGRIMSEGTTNSPQYTTERFRHSHNRKRDRSPHLHNDRGGSELNGDYRPKKSRNGFDAYEYHKMYKNTERPPFPPRENRRHKPDPNEEGDHKLHRESLEHIKKDEPRHKNEEHEETKSVHSSTSDIPPPPPTIPTETFDTALNLSSSEAPAGDDSKVVTAESAETLGDLARLYPMAWHGNLVLKNTGFPTRMHLIGGDPAVVEMLVRCREGKEDASSLRITQRLRLEPPRLDEVNKRMASAGPSGHCILIALPGPTPSQSSPDNSNNGLDTTPNMQLRPLRSLVSYLKQKEAAGIVALNSSGDLSEMNTTPDKDNVGVLHAFPPCEFSHSQLLKVVPNLGPEPAKEDHIVVLLVKGTV